jgi:hypothetical protein
MCPVKEHGASRLPSPPTKDGFESVLDFGCCAFQKSVCFATGAAFVATCNVAYLPMLRRASAEAVGYIVSDQVSTYHTPYLTPSQLSFMHEAERYKGTGYSV